MSKAVSACVHCGFCLPTCPTYAELGEEMDSPRGRIVLMKGALEGELEAEQVAPHVDACLGCVACVTACPSGVRYGELVTPFRQWLETRRRRPLLQRGWRWLLSRTMPHPRRFAALLAAGAPLRAVRRLLPAQLRAALELLPDRRSGAAARHALPLAAAGPPTRGSVALLRGCVQTVLAPELEHTTLEVLRAFGYAVEIPPDQGCCGGLALHSGDLAQARALARRNLAAFDRDLDAVASNAAGCGSALREAATLFSGTGDEDRARRLAGRAKDVSSLLAEALPAAFPEGLPPLAAILRAAYHDPCHLLHAQGERDAPRALLRSIPGLELLEPEESELCCGSAGTYNLEQPHLADRLGERKARNLLATGAQVVVTGNLGCSMQIRRHTARLGRPLEVLHTVEVVALALSGRERWVGSPAADR
ncbi:MAG TPA: heterodisulfide reductase-related iron-sulfur binding cluster [Thermoanaerobaculia bacterium]|nr:heterodisulfide reductase-related iron-sulfur binding cluster [Thermoanaerobaculia bacterium]